MKLFVTQNKELYSIVILLKLSEKNIVKIYTDIQYVFIVFFILRNLIWMKGMRWKSVLNKNMERPLKRFQKGWQLAAQPRNCTSAHVRI